MPSNHFTPRVEGIGPFTAPEAESGLSGPWLVIDCAYGRVLSDHATHPEASHAIEALTDAQPAGSYRIARFPLPADTDLPRMSPMSNESPAFDVLNAEENDLWEWAVERAGVDNAATFIRDATLKALQKPGTPEMGRTDLARARVEGAREALTKYADSARGMAAMMRDRPCSPRNATANDIEHFRDREYPAPKPAECRLSDGSVVTWRAEMTLPQWERVFPDKTATYRPWGQWPSLLKDHDTGADFDKLKAFAATRTEDATDGR